MYTRQKVDLSLLKYHFFNTSITDILRAIRGKSFLGAFTLSMCSIDAMAYLYNDLPNEEIGDNFRNWVKKWIVPINSDCKPDILYALRCGLVHTYGFAKAMENCGLEGFYYVHNQPNKHWKQRHANVFVLNLDSHIAELIIAAYNFFDKLSEICKYGTERTRTIIERIQRLIYLQRGITVKQNDKGQIQIFALIQIPQRYEAMDSVLKALDLQRQPHLGAIEKAIQEIYLMT